MRKIGIFYVHVVHSCMIQLLPIMVGPTSRDIVLPLKVTHVHHMVLGLPECLVISLNCLIYVLAYACIYMYVNVCFTLCAEYAQRLCILSHLCACVCVCVCLCVCVCVCV